MQCKPGAQSTYKDAVAKLGADAFYECDQLAGDIIISPGG
jgi:hypothetical protein